VVSRLKIDWEPMDAPGVADEAEAATWARLEIRLEPAPSEGAPTVLTQVLDKHAKVVRNNVYGTVLPLAEFLVHTWSHVLHARRAEPLSEAEEERYSWERLHRWRFCGEGAAVPDITLVRTEGERLLLSCRKDQDSPSNSYERVLFQADVQAELSLFDYRACVQDFIQSVVNRLRELVPQHPRGRDLLEAWRLVSDRGCTDHGAQRLSARLGLLWWDMGESERDKVRGLASRKLSVLEDTLIDIASLERMDEYLQAAAQAWRHCERAPPAPLAWKALQAELAQQRDEALATASPPWRLGWERARRYRQVLGLADSASPQGEDLGSGLRLEQHMTPLGEVDSIVAWKAGHLPLRLLPAHGASDQPSRQGFARARDLHAVLFEQSPETDYAHVFSRAIAGASSVANAFAAELIAPVQRIKQLLEGRTIVDEDDIADIARELSAPYKCVWHQIDNHRLVRVG
jgi:hypothetical protein